MKIEDLSKPIGVFGYYDELIIDSTKPSLPVSKIWAQDLLANFSQDITPEVRIEKGHIVIPGSLIEKIGLSAATEGDTSSPGLVMNIVTN